MDREEIIQKFETSSKAILLSCARVYRLARERGVSRELPRVVTDTHEKDEL